MKRWTSLLLAGLLCLLLSAACAQEMKLADGAQRVLQAFVGGAYEEIAAQFDDTMRAAVDETALASAWQGVIAQLGEVIGVSGVQEDEASRTALLVLEHAQGSTALVVVYDEAGRIAGLSLSPQPAAAQTIARALPEGVTAKSVTLFEGGDRALSGELLTPAQADAHTPYVVFAHGSGPSDMDETVGGCKPLRDLAYDLAAMGVGSLRYDKITYVHPHLPYETVEQEYLEPVTEALRVLREQISAEHIYLVGHSEGGMLAPYLVSACGFDGGAALAGTPLQLWEISYAQNLALLETLPKEYRDAQLPLIEAERERALALAAASSEEAEQWGTIFGMPARYLWHMAQLDQAQIAEDSGKPFLFLWGDRDFQVSRDAFDAWRARLGDDSRYTYQVYEGLNHLFVAAGEDESIADAQRAYREPRLMDARVAADIAAWITALQ